VKPRAKFRLSLKNGNEVVLTRRDSLTYALSGFLTFTSVPALQQQKPGQWPKDAAVVTEFGAKGDGQADDSKAIQKALDSGNPHVALAPGKLYLVAGGGKGTSKDPDCPLNVRSNTTLWMAGATVKLAPNQREFTSIFRLDECYKVDFRGGRIDGSKDQHDPVTNKGQNGGMHGFTVDGGKRIGLYDLEIVDAFVDGILLRRGVENVTIERIKALGCRRQGMSIIKSNGVVCRHSTFAGTGGQKPEAGVDIEPDHASEGNSNLLFEDCAFIDNAGAGLVAHLPGAPVNGLTIRRCKFAGNRRGDNVDLAFAVIGSVMSNVLIEDCDIERRIELYGKGPAGTFRDWKILSNRLRGPHAAIRTHGFVPTGNSVRISRNKITSGRRQPIYGDQPGVVVDDDNTMVPLS
jgi:polygalacturonase